MEIGIYANTHGQGYRDDTDMYLASSPFEEMRPVRTAQLAEQHGFHSVWYPDHVCMPIQSGSAHTANVSGQRAYQPHHNMLDMAVVMGAVAACTQRIKLGTSVLIAPYRHPLADAVTVASDLASRSHAQTTANDVLTLLSPRRDRLTVVARVVDAGGLQIQQTVRVVTPRLGYTAGRNLLVVGREVDASRNRVSLTLWG